MFNKHLTYQLTLTSGCFSNLNHLLSPGYDNSSEPEIASPDTSKTNKRRNAKVVNSSGLNVVNIVVCFVFDLE